ncbi:hypothetical protein BSKO_00777 [Bryopsis sp. KO-2023]|nr:hypothetical protein BSKO_00777 [Bryopsis sp. KO-2023]
MWRKRTAAESRAISLAGKLNSLEKEERFWEGRQDPAFFSVSKTRSGAPEPRPYGRRRKNYLGARHNAGLWLPFALQIGAGHGGGPDLRLKVFHFTMGAAFAETEARIGSIPLKENAGWVGNLIEAATFAGEIGGVVMAQILFPQVMASLGGIFWMTGLASMLMGPDSIIRKVFSGWFGGRKGGLKKGLGRRPLKSLEGMCDSLNSMALQLSGPITVVFLGHMLWKRMHQRSHKLAESSLALMEVSRSYNVVRQNTSKGKYASDEEIEQAWLDTHKKAAQRVAHLMTDLPSSPPLKPLLDLWESTEMWVFILPESCHGQRGFGMSEPRSVMLSINHGRHAPASTSSSQDREISFSAFESPRRVQQQEDEGPSCSFEQPMERVSSPGKKEWVGFLSRGKGDGGACSSSSEVSVWDSCADAERLSPNCRSSQMPVLNEEENRPSTSGMSFDESELPLFGRQDHAQEEEPLTSLEKTLLVARAVRLFFIFMPVVLFGGIVLVLANSLESGAQKERNAELAAKKQKKASGMKTWAFDRLLAGCRTGGAAFIKWGQWSASREDLFPPEFCDALSQLHDQAPVHSIKETRDAIHHAFGIPLEEIFESFEDEPLASGSIAQVHRATLCRSGRSMPVIVKVCHPGVAKNIHQDFQVLKPLAAWASNIPLLRGLPLKESVSQFSHTMTAQADLRVEAVHIRRMFNNFKRHGDSIVIPALVDELISESVIVESFEAGRSVTHYIKNPSPLNTRIVALGVDAYLKMLLSDNVVHTDLHPGNILVREVEKPDGSSSLQMILLDFGLVEELMPNVRKHFISFLNMISKGDGENAAQHFLHWSDDQQCPDPEAFVQDMVALFEEHCDVQSPEGIDLDKVIKSILLLSRNHRVSIDSSYAAMVVGVCIIVGFATGLDPRVNLMDAATPVLLTYALTGRVVGRMYG